MTTTRVFSGTLSQLVIADGAATALLTHTLRARTRTTPITIPGTVLGEIANLSEGPIALYGALSDNALVVLGPDRRRSTLAAARPRGEMGPPAPQVVAGDLSEIDFVTARATGKLYITGRLRCGDAQGGVTHPVLVRSPIADRIGGEITDGPVRVRAVRFGDTLEILDLVLPE